MEKTGKNITLKDIYNLYPSVHHKGANSIKEVLKLLDKYGMKMFELDVI